MIKQVDDMYIIARNLCELRQRLEIAARESIKRGVTWSISKFFAGREVNIVSGHQVTLDPSGGKPPLIGPDPSRVEKLANMQPPSNIKQVDDMYIIGRNLRELRQRLEIAARDSIKRGVTWSISKFFAGREVNIVSGHQVTLDPSGGTPPRLVQTLPV